MHYLYKQIYTDHFHENMVVKIIRLYNKTIVVRGNHIKFNTSNFKGQTHVQEKSTPHVTILENLTEVSQVPYLVLGVPWLVVPFLEVPQVSVQVVETGAEVDQRYSFLKRQNVLRKFLQVFLVLIEVPRQPLYCHPCGVIIRKILNLTIFLSKIAKNAPPKCRTISLK